MPDAALHLVELRMPSGTWYSLWQPGWADVQDDSGPFLARGGELYVFRTPADLLAWCTAPSDADHELAASPSWAGAAGLPAMVHSDDRVDLTWSMVPVDGELSRDVIPDVRLSAVVLDDLIVATDLELDDPDDPAGPGHSDDSHDPDLVALWRAPELVDLLYDPEHLDSALSGRRRHALADLLRAHGAAVVRLVERRLTLPEPGPAAPPTARAPVASSSVAVPLEQVGALETVWIGLSDSGFYTLRQIVDPGDAPAYLGTAGELLGAAELVDLRRWLSSPAATDGPHDLLAVPGWSRLVHDPDAVDLDVYDDDTVDLGAVGDSLGGDPDEEWVAGLQDAWLLLADLAEWGGWADVSAALEPDTPVGYVLSAVLPEASVGNPLGAARLAATDPTALNEAWDGIVAAVTSRVRLLPAADPA